MRCARRPPLSRRQRCRSRKATTSWWSAAASAGFRRRGSTAARGRRRASSSSTTTTISAATPSATSSRSMAAASSATAAASRCSRPTRSTARSPRACCAISASTSRGSRPPSSASSIRRSACRAACSSTARRSAATCWSTGEPARANADEQRAATPSRCRNSSRIFRFRRRARRRSLRSTPAPAIRWPANQRREKREILKRTSYRDYLTKICGCSEEVANCFQGRPLGFFGLGSDAVPAADARDLGYPGFAGLKLPGDTNPAWSEPYIYHFPDGNASLARLLVRSLIPGVAPGSTMDDVVQAPFDYARARPDASSRSASGSIRPASMSRRPATRCRSPMSATARCIASRRAMPCSPAST